MSINILKIRDLQVKIDEKTILNGVNLEIKSGEIHTIMGPNGSGKSTLCYALMGHPKYEITGGEVTFNGENILELGTDKRAQLGLFLGFQYPKEVPGVTFGNFLRQAANAQKKGADPNSKPYNPIEYYNILQKELEKMRMDKHFIGRGVNQGFSGGEKKRAEIIQMAALKPKIALLDEIDSGLDVDALKTVADGINLSFKENDMGILIITHYQRILDYVKPHFVHIMVKGKIVKSGDASLVNEIETGGYINYEAL